MRSARWIGCGLFLAGISAPLGCEELREIPANRCGNTVIDAMEDCDTFVPELEPNAACGKPDPESDRECRYICGKQEDGSEPECLEGYACGVDQICRRTTGSFDQVGEPFPGDVYQVQLADFDGDGRLDVLTTGANELRLRFFDGDMQLAAMETIPSFHAAPNIGQLTGDTRADFAFRAGPGLGVIRGQGDRTLTPTQYPFESAPPKTDATIIVLDSLLDAYNVDEVLIMFRALTGEATIVNPKAAIVGEGAGFFLELHSLIKGPQRDVAAGDVLTAHKCEDIVVAHRGSKDMAPIDRHGLLVIEPCDETTQSVYETDTKKRMVHVFLPEDHEVRTGPRIADLNGDGNLDLLVGTSMPCTVNMKSTTCCAMEVAYGVPAGDGFSSTLAPGQEADNMMRPVNYIDLDLDDSFHRECPPYDPDQSPVLPLALAVGDLNNDGTVDYVDPERIWLGKVTNDAAGVHLTYEGVSAVGPWSSAVIADFNLDGAPDIIGGNVTVPGLDFYQGSVDQGNLNIPLSSFRIPTTQPPHNLTVGNFDGDLAPDLAISEFSNADHDALSVAFGRPLDVPAAPIEMGRLDTIVQLASGNLARFTYEKDYILDLVAVSARALTEAGQQQGTSGGLLTKAFQESVLLFPGSTDRFLQSPVRLRSRHKDATLKDIDVGDYPYRTVIGQFSGDQHADVAVLTTQVDLQTILDPTKKAQEIDVGLWLLEGTMEADFMLPDPKSLEGKPASDVALKDAVLKSVKSGDLAMVALNLDDDEPEEILILVPDKVSSTTLLFVADADAKERSWSITPEGALFPEDSPMAAWRVTARASVADVNGDDKMDVVALFSGGTDDKESHLVVFWNEGKGISSKSPMTELVTPLNPKDPSGAADYPIAYALLNRDEDAEKELAVLTLNGTYIVEVLPGSPPSLDTPVALQGMPGGLAIAAGDVTGDGLDDLVIGDITGGSIWKSVPKIP
jgi:hypothetical protein